MVDTSLSHKVVEAIAAKEGVSPWQLRDVLYDSIDPDSLDQLFRNGSGRVEFEFNGYNIQVDHEGSVKLLSNGR